MTEEITRAFRGHAKGLAIATAIVAVNFVFVVRMVGLSYSPYSWAQFAGYETPTPTGTPTSTPTATPTSTPAPAGGPCTDTAQCESGLVCLNGVCTENVMVPTMGRPMLVFVVLFLLAVGVALILRRLKT